MEHNAWSCNLQNIGWKNLQYALGQTIPETNLHVKTISVSFHTHAMVPFLPPRRSWVSETPQPQQPPFYSPAPPAWVPAGARPLTPRKEIFLFARPSSAPESRSKPPQPVRPASAPGPQRPGSARPSSARPTSGRPSSGRPSSGRPNSGRPNSGRPTSGHRVRPSSAQSPARPNSARAEARRPASAVVHSSPTAPVLPERPASAPADQVKAHGRRYKVKRTSLGFLLRAFSETWGQRSEKPNKMYGKPKNSKCIKDHGPMQSWRFNGLSPF